MNLPTFRQRDHLVLLAEHGHFARAATACHVTQSTLSAGIKELENILQASLVDRTKRCVVLTPLGRDIVERARRILREGEDVFGVASDTHLQVWRADKDRLTDRRLRDIAALLDHRAAELDPGDCRERRHPGVDALAVPALRAC